MGSSPKIHSSGAAATAKLHIPLAYAAVIGVYIVLQVALLSGSAFLSIGLAVMALWSLTVATISHPGRVVGGGGGGYGSDPEGVEGGGHPLMRVVGSAEVVSSAHQQLLQGVTKTAAGGGGGGGSASPQFGATELVVGNGRSHAVAVADTDVLAVSPSVEGHFTPQRLSVSEGMVVGGEATTASASPNPQSAVVAIMDDELGSTIPYVSRTVTPVRQASLQQHQVLPSPTAVVHSTSTSFLMSNHLLPNSNTLATTATNTSVQHRSPSATLRQLSSNLLSLAFNKMADTPEAGMLTPTVSERSFATTSAATSVSKSGRHLLKDERRERKLAKELEKLEKRRLKEQRKGDPLYCRKCDSRRPPRTHHCRVCNDCVVRYDHHCVWIDNCIGAGNIKAFYLFVIYVCIGIVHYVNSMGTFLVSGTVWATVSTTTMGYLLFLLALVYTVAMGFAAVIGFSFLKSTTMGLARNYTAYELTLEADTLGRYDKGDWSANMREVLGDDWRWWLVPMAPLRNGRHLTAVALLRGGGGGVGAGGQWSAHDAV